jgi:6-phosphogluconate dehydrogenase
MTPKIINEKCAIGMVGLGVMGRNLLLNMADHGFSVAGYDKDKDKVDSLQKESKEHDTVHGATNITEFINLLQKPRAIMLLVPAGAPVDLVINDLLPHLEKNDLIIDAGNSHFTDTDNRAISLNEKGIRFLGVGVSGGEEGARRGPSIMPGGPKEAYEQVRHIFEAVAASVNGEPCVAYLGPKSSGHYVKMVHNGIEYGIMQLIAETYDLMKRGLGLNNDQLREIYHSWNDGEMNSYLIEITSHIFGKKEGSKQLIDEILDVAKQNGTGMWTSQSAMELQIPIPTIDLAVSMRDLSVLVNQRNKANNLYQLSKQTMSVDHNEFIKQLHDALFAAMIIVYAQGMSLLSSASEKYAYQLDLETVARIWRGGCIIRAKLLEDIRSAYRLKHDLPNLLLDPNIAQKIIANQNNLRQVVSYACMMGIPTPALMVTLSYFDAYRSSWLPANLIQAQRDYFGSHKYERINEKGTFHTEWEKDTSL